MVKNNMDEEVTTDTYGWKAEAPPALAVPTTPAVTPDDETRVARTLGGSPAAYPDFDLPVLLALQATGHAADFGEDGWARGHRWHEKYGR